jgi:GntR family transcriptional regulator, negative regulator for fad regulon and positive regulator of fabA
MTCIALGYGLPQTRTDPNRDGSAGFFIFEVKKTLNYSRATGRTSYHKIIFLQEAPPMSSENHFPQLLRPMQHTEHRLLSLILSGEYPPGSTLPNERILSQQFGVTRSTLRETLQRLSREGWVTIQHGKATRVNDFWREGGLSLLGTLASYAQYLPMEFIQHLLELRVWLLPGIAERAASHAPDDLVRLLHGSRELGEAPADFVKFDWELQIHMARAAQNPLGVMIFNDFRAIFHQMAGRYFALEKGRDASRRYYRKLAEDLAGTRRQTAAVVTRAMQESMAIWLEIQPGKQGDRHVSMERLG